LLSVSWTDLIFIRAFLMGLVPNDCLRGAP